MKNKNIILFLILLLPSIAPAQILDSLKLYFQQKPRLAFRFDSKTSFISNNSSNIWGLNLGLDFSQKLKTGIGYYFLYPQLNRRIKIEKGISLADTSVNAALSFNYGGIFAEFVFYDKNKWETCFTLHLGMGVSRYTYDINNKRYQTDHGFMGLYEANISAQYRILYWLGLGGGIGYRLMLMDKNISDENFNSPIYTTKIKIFFGDLYRKYFPKK